MRNLFKPFGFTNPHEILDKVIDMWGKKLPVVGVVKDFHTVSLRQPIEATAMMNRIRGYETLSINVDVKQIQDVINIIKTKMGSCLS